MLLEIYFFFCWIAAGIVFLIFAYTTKMQTFLQNTHEIETDDNPWNNKNTEDFLRHLKREYFTMSYSIAFLLLELTTGFSNMWNIDVFGPKDMSVSGALLIMCMVPRFIKLISLSVFSLYGYDAVSPQMRYLNYTLITVDSIALIVLIVALMTMSESIKNQNVVVRMLIIVETCTKIIEPLVAIYDLTLSDRVQRWLALEPESEENDNKKQ